MSDPDRDDSATGRFTFSADELSFLLTHVREAVICCDRGGIITFASPGLRELTGYDPSTVVGTSVFGYLHADDVADAAERLSRWIGRKGATVGPDMRVRTAAGEYRSVEVEALTGPQIEPVGALAITLRPADGLNVERELRQRLVNEDRLTRLARAFMALPVDRFDEGIDAALAEMGSLEGVDRVSVWRLVDEELEQTHEWTAPDIPPRSGPPPRLSVDSGELVRQLIRLQEVSVPSTAALGDLAADSALEHLRAGGVRSCLAVPMVNGGRFTGFLTFEALREERQFETSHVTTLRTAAGILAEAFARRLVEERLAHQARHDALTGLGNRWFFLESLEESLRALDGTSDRRGVAVALFDLDRFKVVNDSLGHSSGDQLLTEIAQRLAGELAPTIVGRLGGDEFVVLFDGVATAADAVSRAAAAKRCFEEPVFVADHQVFVTASAGVAFCDRYDEEPEELLRQADAAMYAAKERGRNRIELFDDDLRRQAHARLRWETELRIAIREGQLRVYYQPEIDIDTGQIIGAEALIRWNHPRLGILTAGDFINVAEETAAILDIGPWVLREALLQRRRWDELLQGRPFQIRVNLSARQVAQPDLVPTVVSLLEETGADPTSLCLEITETTLMSEPATSLEVLEKLRGLGVELAVDDFGTGYSSLAYLKRLPVHVVKIDRSFVDGLGRDPDDTAIVAAIMGLAGALGLEVTAEGVETERQLEELRRLGCHRIQGFLLARPEPAEAVAARLASPAPH
jgi:diguanylate cyclase (GGDEF)-like protein/PAS domain S-box-containing protein